MKRYSLAKTWQLTYRSPERLCNDISIIAARCDGFGPDGDSQTYVKRKKNLESAAHNGNFIKFWQNCSLDRKCKISLVTGIWILKKH